MSPSDAPSRRLAREELATLIDTVMVAGGSGILNSVYDHKASFAPLSPVCLVLSGGSKRAQAGMSSTRVMSEFRLLVIFFVIEVSDDAAWTPAEVEDKLDDCEKKFTDLISDNRGPVTNWNYIKQDPEDFSNVLPAEIGGKPYTAEVMNVIARKTK